MFSLLNSMSLNESFLSPSFYFGIFVVLFVLLLPTAYYFFLSSDFPCAPPRLSLLPNLLSGTFNLKAEGALAVVRHGYEQLGEIFRIQFFHQPVTFLIGPEPNKFVFEAKDSQLSQREVYHFTIPVFGKNIVYDAPPKIMMQQLKFVNKGLNQINMQTHAGKIAREAEEFFSKWPNQGEVDVHKEFSDLIILTASRCLLGNEIRDNVQSDFASHYQDLSDGMSHLSVFFPNAPTAAHRKRDHARSQLAAIFSKVIRARRLQTPEETEKHQDFLQVLVDARYTDDSTPTDDEITGLLIAALFGGQHTSNITSTWMGYLINKNKSKFMPRILEEQKRVMEKYDGAVTLDGLAEMEYLHVCMKETLRLYPPLILLMRKVLEPMQYKGYTIPKGDIVAVCPPVSHRLSHVFSDPSSYDPDRFLGERAEDQKQKFSFLSFGGGRHGCLGERFAFLQVKTIWSVLFRNFDFELIGDLPERDFSAIVVGPKLPCMMRFKRKNDPYSWSEKVVLDS